MARHGNRIWPSRLGWLALVVIVGLLVYRFWMPSADTSSRLSSKQVSVAVPLAEEPTSATSQTSASQESTSQISTSEPAAVESDSLAKPAHPLDPVLEMAKSALQRFRAEVHDYRCKLVKRERLNGSLMEESVMQLKVIHLRQPNDPSASHLGVYLGFEQPAKARGREVIWRSDRNQGKLIAHEGGMLNVLRVQLDPLSTLAMLGNKYPITQIGLERLLQKLIEKGERDRELGPCQVRMVSGESIGGRPCQLIQVTHPERKPEYDFHVAQIFIDEERQLPLRYAAFDWPVGESTEKPLLEEYTYLDLELNVQLSDSDFDPDNDSYHFP